jgi:uncharacterized protein
MKDWEQIFIKKARALYPATDPSHDWLHIRRVVASACRIAEAEGADMNVVLPAAYFHDFVNVPKGDPRRKEASRLSAEAAVEYLNSIDYPAHCLDAVAHAITAHSFSAGIAAETLEAKVVQDADRLDALGAVGLARMFTVCGLTQRPFYHEDDLFAESRPLDDVRYGIDHVFVKLFRVAETLHTETARAEGARRVLFMKDYLRQLQAEAG